MRWLILATVLVFVLQATAGAHRLDEYLQATRVAIERDRVTVDVDLTAGVSIARQVAEWIDTNRDGEISASESTSYGRDVLGSVALAVDGTPMALNLISAEAPTVPDMSGGVGTMRLRAAARVTSMAPGRHQLSIINTHHPEASVYLANALVPSDKRIKITEQRRSTDQHSLTIQYEVAGAPYLSRLSWMLSAVTLLAATLWSRRRLGGSTTGPARRV